MDTPNREGGLRGSQKLLEKLARNGETPAPEDIIREFNLPASVKIPNWLIRGIPPIYLELEGTLEVPIVEVAAVVERFVALNDSAITLNILINGVPRVDAAQVIVSNAARQ
jgi:hypothetical protein